MPSIHASATSPAALILARVEAFCCGDFAFIFDSYHADSNFRGQFPDRDAYLHYGRSTLGAEFRILACTIVRETIEGGTARVIFALEIEVHGERQRYAELAWLEQESGLWRYRCGQKLDEADWPVPVRRLDYRHFAAAPGRILY